MRRLHPLALSAVLLVGAACESGGGSPSGQHTVVDVQPVLEAMAACSGGRPDAGLAVLDRALADAAPSPDAYAVRGLCRWTRFAADSARADIEGAYADLTASIEAERDPRGDDAIPLDRAYSHRAFVTLARDPAAYGAALADLEAASRAAPQAPDHVLDRGVIQTMRGDTAAAVAAFRDALALADSADTRRQALARRMLADLDAEVDPPDS